MKVPDIPTPQEREEEYIQMYMSWFGAKGEAREFRKASDLSEILLRIKEFRLMVEKYALDYVRDRQKPDSQITRRVTVEETRPAPVDYEFTPSLDKIYTKQQ